MPNVRLARPDFFGIKKIYFLLQDSDSVLRHCEGTKQSLNKTVFVEIVFCAQCLVVSVLVVSAQC